MQQEEPSSRTRCRPPERVGASSDVCARAHAHVHAHPHLHTRFPQQCSAPKPSELSPARASVPTSVTRLRGSSAPRCPPATATHASGEGSRRHSCLAGVDNDANFVFPVCNCNRKSLPAFPCLQSPCSCWQFVPLLPCPAHLRVLVHPSMPAQRRVLCSCPSSASCRRRCCAQGVILWETIVPRAVPRLGRAPCSGCQQAGSGALRRQPWSAPRHAGSRFVLPDGCGSDGIKIDYGPRANPELMQ